MDTVEVDEELCERFLKEKFETRQWSYSAVSSFLQCPYSWYNTYILGNRTGNYHAYVGTSFHEVMEDYYNFMLRGGELDIQTIHNTLHKKLSAKFENNPFHAPHKMKSAIETNMLSSIKYFVPNNRVKSAERKINFKVADYNFVGYLDLDEGAARHHYDFKSKLGESHYPQQYLYMYGKKMVDKTSPKGFGIIAYKQNLDVDYVYWDDAKADVYETVDNIIAGVEGIKEALKSGDFPQTNPNKFFCTELCRAKDCPYAKKG